MSSQPAHKPPKAKVVPSNVEAEQSVLGSLLIDPQAIYKIIDLLASSDFYKPAHQHIYTAIVKLTEKSQPVDVMSVTNYFKDKGDIQSVGGSSYLAELTNYVTTASHVQHYAELVREKKVLRDLISAAAAITEDALEGTEDIDELIDSVEKRIIGVTQRSVVQNFVSISDELQNALTRLQTMHDNRDALRGVTTGFKKLDSLLSGLQRSNLVILGARPSLGKTTLALDIARAAAEKGGVPVGIFSLEMSRDEVVDRLIASSANISLWKLRTGKLQEGDQEIVTEGADVLSRAPIFIDDTPSPTVTQMRAMARRLQMQHGLGLIVVDYLQLINPGSKGRDNMVQQITEISRGLKLLARELNVPVLALSQLSRNVDQRENRKPQLHDLRESGSIEQDADVVLFIYRHDRDLRLQNKEVMPEEEGKTEIIIAKHRNGPLGTVEVRFNQDAVSFREVDTRHQASEPQLHDPTGDLFFQ